MGGDVKCFVEISNTSTFEIEGPCCGYGSWLQFGPKIKTFGVREVLQRAFGTLHPPRSEHTIVAKNIFLRKYIRDLKSSGETPTTWRDVLPTILAKFQSIPRSGRSPSIHWSGNLFSAQFQVVSTFRNNNIYMPPRLI